MSRLDRLIAAEREAMVPSAAARVANLGALQRALADGRTPIVEAPPIAGPFVTARRGWMKPLLIGALVVGIAALAVLFAGPAHEDSPAAAPVADEVVEPPAIVANQVPDVDARAVAPPHRADAVTPAIVPAPPPATPDRPAPTRAKKSAAVQGERDDFAAELALLKRAKTSHTAGDRERALAVLREQARQFPRGAFVEERRALEAIVLCELGRRQRGDAAAAAFYRDFAASPQTERVRRACD